MNLVSSCEGEWNYSQLINANVGDYVNCSVEVGGILM